MGRREFECPECTQRIEMNEPMCEAVLADGCPVCGAAVAPEQFTPPVRE